MVRNFESLQKIYRSIVINAHNQLAYESAGIGSYPINQIPTTSNATTTSAKPKPQAIAKNPRPTTDFWAKGTGYGTGNMEEHWSLTAHVEKRKQDEEMISCLLKVFFQSVAFIFYLDTHLQFKKNCLRFLEKFRFLCSLDGYHVCISLFS